MNYSIRPFAFGAMAFGTSVDEIEDYTAEALKVTLLTRP